MARQLRVEYSGAIYHLTVRSNGEDLLFKSDVDRKYLLSRLAEAQDFYSVRVYLYGLMSNHFHLVVETPKGNVSRFMQGLLTGYGVYFNRANRRHGHVTQGRFGDKLVEGDSYLLNLSRYVHLNPVKIGEMVSKPLAERIAHLRAYPWSSYPAYIGEGARNEFVDYGPMLALTGSEKRYRAFVESAVEEDDEAFQGELRKSVRSIGSDKFREWVDDRYRKLVAEHRALEDVSFRRVVAGPVSPERILDLVSATAKVERSALLTRKRDSRWRAVAARMLCTHGGLTQREAATVLGLGTGVAVSCQLRHLNDLLAAEPAFRKRVEKFTRRMSKGDR